MGWRRESGAKDLATLGFDAVSGYARGGRYGMEQPAYAKQCELIRRDRWEKCRTLRIPCITIRRISLDCRIVRQLISYPRFSAARRAPARP